MGQIKKIGDLYYIEFYARGLLYSKIGGTDRAAAEKLLAETEAAIAGGEALTVVRHIPLADFFDRFLTYAHQEFGGRSAGRFQALITHFQTFLYRSCPHAIHLADLTPSVFEEYKAQFAKSSAKRVNLSILLLREMMEYGIKLGFINDNPTIHMRLLPVPGGHKGTSARYTEAQELFAKGVPLGKIYKCLALTDIGRIVYFMKVIPLSRADMYNL